MAEIVAQCAERASQSRRVLRTRETVVLGRDSSGWSVPWEPWLSRRHLELTWEGKSSRRTRYRREEPRILSRRAGRQFWRCVTESAFVIGNTTFRLNADEASSPTPTPVSDNAAILHSFTVSRTNSDRCRFATPRDASTY